MKVVILAGGLGTRIAEESETKPKPLVEIGGYPILWHIMKIYAAYGFEDFLVALGYKGELVKRYFLDYQSLRGNISVNLSNGKVTSSQIKPDENWSINLIDTGRDSMTGGRVKRLQDFIANETFMVSYGDGVADVDIGKLLQFHRSHGKTATVTAVRPPARYGEITFNSDETISFTEKPPTREVWINGGFFVFEPNVFDYLPNDSSIMEKDALEVLAGESQLCAYRHDGFWQCMDNLHDKRRLEKLWQTGNPPWKIW